MRLIDADELNKELEILHRYHAGREASLGVGACIVKVRESPTVGIEPVRHSYWVNDPMGEWCRACHSDGNKDDLYCRVCGAKMDGKEPT